MSASRSRGKRAQHRRAAQVSGSDPFPGFQFVRFQQVANSDSRRSRLDERPAVYAWYRRLEPQESSAEALQQHVDSLLLSATSPLLCGKVGYLYRVTVQEQPGPLPDEKRDYLHRLLRDASFRDYLRAFLRHATVLQAPLYVGKTVRLRTRVGEHIDGVNSDLLELLATANLSLSDCVLRFTYTGPSSGNNAPLPGGTEKRTLLLEDLLTRLTPAAFVRRPG
jgi:hypothetical protein